MSSAAANKRRLGNRRPRSESPDDRNSCSLSSSPSERARSCSPTAADCTTSISHAYASGTGVGCASISSGLSTAAVAAAAAAATLLLATSCLPAAAAGCGSGAPCTSGGSRLFVAAFSSTSSTAGRTAHSARFGGKVAGASTCASSSSAAGSAFASCSNSASSHPLGSVGGASQRLFHNPAGGVRKGGTALLVADSRQLRFSSGQTAGLGITTDSTSSGGSASRSNGPKIKLTDEEAQLFDLLTRVVDESPGMTTTLRVAGGWVRDKLLATKEFRRGLQYQQQQQYANAGDGGSSEDEQSQQDQQVVRLTRKFLSKSRSGPSMGRQGTKIIGGGTSSSPSLVEKSAPVDIDIAIDDMLGREFADHLNEWLSEHGRDTVNVGVVLANPEKSKHLETATMKVGNYFIDFVNLRAEEYTEDSRIPDLMRIGTAMEDALRRDLTINSLFYNINTGELEDMTGRGLTDLRRGIIATPLPPLTTLLDDPLRVLRSVRFAARLRFTMDDDLRHAASDPRVRSALAQKVSRERVGGEVDLMLRSPDPVGAMRLLVNLRLADTVFPVNTVLPYADRDDKQAFFDKGLVLLSTGHDHLVDCKMSPPVWCAKSWSRDSAAAYGAVENILLDDEEGRRLLWYASFLKPLYDETKAATAAAKTSGRNKSRPAVTRFMVDELKRPTRDAESVEKIMKAADDFTRLIQSGSDLTATAILLGEVRVWYDCSGRDECPMGPDDNIDETTPINPDEVTIRCNMISPSGTKEIDCVTEDDPVWLHAMEYRLTISKILGRVGALWRAALILSLSEQLAKLNDDELNYAIEGDFMEQDFQEVRRGVIEQYDAFAASFLQLGLMGIWSQKPLIDGGEMKKNVLPGIPKGPVFRDVMDEQIDWMTLHPGGSKQCLVEHLAETFPDFVD